MERSPKAETEACLTLLQVERLLVRYVVDNYNQAIDARMGDQTRLGRWEAGRMAQLPLLGERELDLCLMRRDQRTVYRSGYLQFASLTYQGEHLAAYAGETVILRYNPRDVTTVYIYQLQDNKEVFLTRAHAQGLETEILAYAEAKAMSRRIRAAGQEVSQKSLLNEVRDRDLAIEKLQRQKQKRNSDSIKTAAREVMIETNINQSIGECEQQTLNRLKESNDQKPIAIETPEQKPKKPVPYVRVYENYEQVRREAKQP